MRKKRWFVLGFLLVGIAAVVLTTLALLPLRPGVTRANFDRIEAGMTRAEVEALFGEEPNGAVRFFGDQLAVLLDDGRQIAAKETRDWASYDITATIYFDRDGRVVHTSHTAGWHDNRTLWQKLRSQVTGRQDPPPQFYLTFPDVYYLQHEPQYFPPSEPYPFPKELQSLEEAQRKLAEDAQR